MKLIKSYIPRPLPTGMAAFNEWVADVVELSGLPNNDSTRRLAAVFIMQTPPNVARISLRKLADLLIKAAAYQVANEVLKLQKEADEARLKEANQTVV